MGRSFNWMILIGSALVFVVGTIWLYAHDRYVLQDPAPTDWFVFRTSLWILGVGVVGRLLVALTRSVLR